jgi:hypothetical protein
LISQYRNYGKVCCFKGFNSLSFAFNTGAEPELFAQQLSLFRRYVELGFDLYAYATFTTPVTSNIQDDMNHFMDALQSISENLPLRVIPLEIQNFAPMQNRVRDEQKRAIQNQWLAIECWQSEVERRFKEVERKQRISAIPL